MGLSGEFLKNARALADMANKAQVEEGPDCPVGAVLFHDCDGTNTSDRCRFEKKWESMESGFAREEFVYGIPMIPKPKSEAWLLCAFNTTPYQACAKLEELSGNDASPYSAKSKLDQRLTALGKTLNDLPDMVQKGSVDAARIDMPSFNMFRDRLSEVVRAMLGLPA